jgi:mannitol-1-phosphate 5-dehydrogenase
VAPVLEAAVREAASAERLTLPRTGFAGAIAWAAVSRGDWRAAGTPEFVGDAWRVMHVDATRLATAPPALPGVVATPLYGEHLWAKRMIFSAGHALLAYLGLQRGHRFVDEAARDNGLCRLVRNALTAARAAVLREHPALAGELSVCVDWAFERYANTDLRDPLTRVARDPIRKLHAEGPLVGPARLVQRTLGRAPAAFPAGIAAALAHDDPADAQARELGERLAVEPVSAVLRDVTLLHEDHPLAGEVLAAYRRATLHTALALMPVAA